MMPLTKRMLIIDDELGFIHVFKKSLAAYGITDIEEVTSGEEAKNISKAFLLTNSADYPIFFSSI